jgi:shikimate dehydrogenase
LSAVSAGQAGAAAYELIVNCTAIGLEPGDDPFAALPISPEHFGRGSTLVDLVYRDEQTRLAAVAAERGARVIDGIEVLVHQGAQSLRIWTGLEPPLEEMSEAARRGQKRPTRRKR